MQNELVNKPGWLQTLWNVAPGLADRAEQDLIKWVQNGIDPEIEVVIKTDHPE